MSVDAPLVFISYRRADTSQAASWLAECLRRSLGPGRIFIDEDSLRAGEGWAGAIESALRRATVLLAIIGPEWLNLRDPHGRRRLDSPGDWVQREIAFALQRPETLVVPVLVGATAVPVAEALPLGIARLADVQWHRIHDKTALQDLLGLLPILQDRGFEPARDIAFPNAPRFQELRSELVERLEQRLLDRQMLEPGEDTELIETDIQTLVKTLTAAPSPKQGTIILDRELVRPLGMGSFGTVWKAKKPGDPRDLQAIKVFRTEQMGVGVMLWRFRRSVRAMHQITNHRDAPRSIVRVRSVSDDGLAFAMDYFPGGNLERIDELGWSLGEKIRKFLVICEAVAFSHRIGVVHRDIKPANVLLDQEHEPVLTDFDIADIKFVTQISISGGGLGTQLFAAPEQLVDAKVADERSDIYSLGRLLHFLLVEGPPGLQLNDPPELDNLKSFPAPLVDVVRKATRLSPGNRHATVQELMRDVERFRSTGAHLETAGRRVGRWVFRYTAVFVAMLVAAAAIASAWRIETQRRQDLAVVAELEQLVNESVELDREWQSVHEQLALLVARDPSPEQASSGSGEDREAIRTLRADKASLEAKITALEKELSIKQQELAAVQPALTIASEHVKEDEDNANSPGSLAAMRRGVQLSMTVALTNERLCSESMPSLSLRRSRRMDQCRQALADCYLRAMNASRGELVWLANLDSPLTAGMVERGQVTVGETELHILIPDERLPDGVEVSDGLTVGSVPALTDEAIREIRECVSQAVEPAQSG